MSIPKLILFRIPRHQDTFETLFEQNGWDVRSIPVLAFTFSNQEKLKANLFDSASFGGIIVTSPRAGDLLAMMISEDPELKKVWKEQPIVCVGQRTAEKLIHCGLTPLISKRASSKAVAQQVIELEIEGRWLFVCGNLRREELPLFLTQAGVPFEELQVYETHPNTNMNLHGIDAPDWVVFFSPSGVQAVKAVWPQHWINTKIAAIGMTTARAVEQAGWEVASIAVKPEAESLLEALVDVQC